MTSKELMELVNRGQAANKGADLHLQPEKDKKGGIGE